MVPLYFVFAQPRPDTWRDGMWAAMKLLERYYAVTWVNTALGQKPPEEGDHVLLAWGDFESVPETTCRHLRARVKALQMGGMAMCSIPIDNYDVVFAETEWHRASLAEVRGHPCVLRAFGVNTDVYYPRELPRVFDWITVGSWTYWKRQHLLHDLPGTKLVVGDHFDSRNPMEAPAIIEGHLRAGVTLSPFVAPERLATYYNISRACYVPAETLGGGERAVMEAKACGLPVMVATDNPKLTELANGPVLSHYDFALALRNGIERNL